MKTWRFECARRYVWRRETAWVEKIRERIWIRRTSLGGWSPRIVFQGCATTNQIFMSEVGACFAPPDSTSNGPQWLPWRWPSCWEAARILKAGADQLQLLFFDQPIRTFWPPGSNSDTNCITSYNIHVYPCVSWIKGQWVKISTHSPTDWPEILGAKPSNDPWWAWVRQPFVVYWYTAIPYTSVYLHPVYPSMIKWPRMSQDTSPENARFD